MRAFVEVVKQGGFSQAAKVVFATQSTISKAVKQLEDEIGVPRLPESTVDLLLESLRADRALGLNGSARQETAHLMKSRTTKDSSLRAGRRE